MKITFVLPQYSEVPIGGYKVVYEYANYLVGSGHDITIVYPLQLKSIASNRSELNRLSWPRQQAAQLAYIIRKPKIDWYSLDDKIRLIKVRDLEAHRVPNADAIFATHWHTAAHVNEYSHKKGAKFYLVMDFPPWFGDKRDLEQTWRLPLKKVAISSWLAGLVRQSGAPKQDITAIPIAVNHDRFRVANSVLERPKRVIMLYSPNAYKRSGLGLSALLKCKAIVPNLEVTFFSPFRQRPTELPSWIEYYGGVSERQLIKLYNAASICLCSSALEGFALPPAEAMACGCAVATTDCGGNRDYAEHEKTALVSAPDDFTSLANNVLRLLSDDELRVKIALAGRDRIAEFTWEKSTQRLLGFVNRHS